MIINIHNGSGRKDLIKNELALHRHIWQKIFHYNELMALFVGLILFPHADDSIHPRIWIYQSKESLKYSLMIIGFMEVHFK